MICQMSKGRNLDILLSDSCDDAVFLKLFNVYPIPKLSEIKVWFYNHQITIASYMLCNHRLSTTLGIVVFIQLVELAISLSFHSSWKYHHTSVRCWNRV